LGANETEEGSTKDGESGDEDEGKYEGKYKTRGNSEKVSGKKTGLG
jgi:hypothetical protein